jgi:zinc-ribbon domain
MARRARSSFPCPNCGAEVRAGARSCPECGSDDETGWSDDVMYDGLDLPDPGPGEDEGAHGGAARRPRKTVAARAYRIAALLILVVLAAAAVGRLARIW